MNFNGLQDCFVQLENFVMDGHYEDLWPIADMDRLDKCHWLLSLHHLAWECLAMRRREDMPAYQLYDHGCFEYVCFTEMIAITRTLLQYCDERVITAFRPLFLHEEETITKLQELHSAMIGQYYLQHPGMESVSAQDIRFAR